MSSIRVNSKYTQSSHEFVIPLIYAYIMPPKTNAGNKNESKKKIYQKTGWNCGHANSGFCCPCKYQKSF